MLSELTITLEGRCRLQRTCVSEALPLPKPECTLSIVYQMSPKEALHMGLVALRSRLVEC